MTCVLLSAALTGAFVMATANEFPDARSYEPVIVRANQLAVFEGKEVAKLEAYRWTNSSWQEIPFQIDEREPGHDIAADSLNPARQCNLPASNTPPSNCSDVYLPEWTQAGLPTADGLFFGLDEFVVMAHDLGDRATTADGLPTDDSDFETTRYEVRARDPISGNSGWFYIFAHTTTSFTKSGTSYVTYEVPSSGSCAGDRTPRQSCGTVSASPTSSTQSSYYKMQWAGNWTLATLEIEPPTDLLDRVKGRAVPVTGGNETEKTWDWGVCPIFRGYTAGPVRLVRSIQGAQSGVVTLKNEFVYGRFVDVEIEFRGHEINSFKWYLDYDPAATPLGNRLRFDVKGGSTTSKEDDIDGEAPVENFTALWDAWKKVSNNELALVHLFREGPEKIKTKDADDANIENRSFTYLDDKAEYDGTGDQYAYGNHGVLYENLGWNQDENCTDKINFGRIRRRIILFHGDDLPDAGTDYDINTGFAAHFKPSNAIRVTTCTRPDGCGSGSIGCLEPLWSVNPDPSGGFNDITNQDCNPPAAGWNLYKRLAGQQSFQFVGPIRTNVVFRDRDIRRGVTYEYALKPFDESGDEGPMTSSKSVTVTDTVPPPPPDGMTAAAGQGMITVSWDPVHAGDAYEYNVYASSATGGPYDMVTAHPVETRTYIITNLQQGETMYVVVTAVDTSGNESTYSGEASATAQ